MATYIWDNIGLGYGLLPDGTKPLPEPMLTSDQSGSMTFTWEQSRRVFKLLVCMVSLKITLLKLLPRLSGANELIHASGWSVINVTSNNDRTPFSPIIGPGLPWPLVSAPTPKSDSFFRVKVLPWAAIPNISLCAGTPAPSHRPIAHSWIEANTLCWSHMSFITMTSQWAWWRLRSPASRLFTQPFIRAQIKENIKALCHWPLCGEVNSPHKGLVTRNMFPFDDVTMLMVAKIIDNSAACSTVCGG